MQNRIEDYIRSCIYLRDDGKPILQCNGNTRGFIFYPDHSIELPTKATYLYDPEHYNFEEHYTFEVDYVLVSVSDNKATYLFTVVVE